jgi:hypothetical protein
MLKILRGLVLNPVLVSFARGIAEAMAMAGILFAGEFLLSSNIPDQYQFLVPAGTYLLRQLEGIADAIDPMKQRRREILAESSKTDDDGNPTA